MFSDQFGFLCFAISLPIIEIDALAVDHGLYAEFIIVEIFDRIFELAWFATSLDGIWNPERHVLFHEEKHKKAAISACNFDFCSVSCNFVS